MKPVLKLLFATCLLMTLSFCSSQKEKSKGLKTSPDFITPEHTSLEEKSNVDFGPQNKKTIYFEEVSSLLGLEGQEAVNLYAVDWSGDGYTDLVVLPDFFSIPVFYLYNSKLERFEKQENPFSGDLRVSFLTFADFNKDGRLDFIAAVLNQESDVFEQPLRLYISRLKNGKIYYEGMNGAFPNEIEATASIGLFDYDMDGWLDLFVGNWYVNKDGKREPAPDNLYHGEPGGVKFRQANGHLEEEYNYSDELQVYTNARPTYGVSICDIDQNGYVDVLAASSGGFHNKLWLNISDKDGVNRLFRDVAKESGFAEDSDSGGGLRGGGNTFYGICQDYNDDGIFDIAVGELVNALDPESRDRSSILTGSNPRGNPSFIRTEYHKDDGSGRWSQGDRRGVWVDLDHDSFIDLLITNSGFPLSSRLIFFRQERDHSFADEATKYGLDLVNPSGVVSVDFNRDGKIDLISGQSNLRDSRIKSRIYAFQNKIESDNRSLWLELKGVYSNPHGLGARIKLITTGRSYLRNVEYSSGGLPGQNEMKQLFTLDVGEKPLELQVFWSYKKKDGKQLITKTNLKNLSFKKNIWLQTSDQNKLKTLRKN